MVYAGSTSERFAALQGGGVSAAILTQPFDLMAMSQGKPTLGWVGDFIKAYPASAVAVNRAWAGGHQDELARYLRASVKAYDWLANPANKEGAVQVLTEVAKLDEGFVRKTYELYFEQGKQVLYPRLRMEPADVEGSLDARIALGEEKPTVPISRYFDGSYLDKAIAEVGR
jgi:NitT/TauT family transport system substrate-binding protein